MSAIRVISPPADLAWAISAFVLRHEHVDGRVVRMLPDMRPSLQIMLGDDFAVKDDSEPWVLIPRAGLWGPRTRLALGHAARQVSVVAAGLTPAGLQALGLGFPGQWLDRIVDAVPLIGPLPLVLQTRQAASETLLPTLEDWLRPALSKPPATPGLVLPGLAASIGEAAARSGLSPRQYLRRFQAEWGLTPKAWQRHSRISALLSAYHPKPWEGDAGGTTALLYADEPHLIREFKALTGLTPRAYRTAMTREGGAPLRSVPTDLPPPPWINQPVA